MPVTVTYNRARSVARGVDLALQRCAQAIAAWTGHRTRVRKVPYDEGVWVGVEEKVGWWCWGTWLTVDGDYLYGHCGIGLGFDKGRAVEVRNVASDPRLDAVLSAAADEYGLHFQVEHYNPPAAVAHA